MNTIKVLWTVWVAIFVPGSEPPGFQGYMDACRKTKGAALEIVHRQIIVWRGRTYGTGMLVCLIRPDEGGHPPAEAMPLPPGQKIG